MTTPFQDALARTAPPAMQLRHVGMYVRDIDVMAAFYREVLGFVETDRGEIRGQWVVFLTRDADERPHRNAGLDDETLEDLLSVD